MAPSALVRLSPMNSMRSAGSGKGRSSPSCLRPCTFTVASGAKGMHWVSFISVTTRESGSSVPITGEDHRPSGYQRRPGSTMNRPMRQPSTV